MRTFDDMGEGIKCIICGTSKPGKTILIGKDGTQDGKIEEAVPVHLDCIELRYSEEAGLIYQKVGE